MLESRVEVIGQDSFKPREWLRREAVWGSLMASYPEQMNQWLNDTEADYLMSNASRRDLFARDSNPESAALSFFNQGKNISSLISAAVLFKMYEDNSEMAAPADIFAVQADAIDNVLTRAEDESVNDADYDLTLSRCRRYARIGLAIIPKSYGRSARLARAGVKIRTLASAETRSWLADAQQDENASLPQLVINNGGHTRSAGRRVEMLRPVFEEIIGSPQYTSLALS